MNNIKKFTYTCTATFILTLPLSISQVEGQFPLIATQKFCTDLSYEKIKSISNHLDDEIEQLKTLLEDVKIKQRKKISVFYQTKKNIRLTINKLNIFLKINNRILSDEEKRDILNCRDRYHAALEEITTLLPATEGTLAPVGHLTRI